MKPNCISFAPAWKAAFATKPPEESYAAACRSASCGAIRMARCGFIPTRPSPAPCAPCSIVSPNWGPRGRCGCGSAAKACSFLYDRAYMARSAGSPPPTQRFTMSSPIRCMLALTSTARRSMSATPIQRATSRNAPGACPWANGRCYFRSIIPDSSTGPPTKPIKNALMATRIRNPTTGCPLGPGL